MNNVIYKIYKQYLRGLISYEDALKSVRSIYIEAGLPCTLEMADQVLDLMCEIQYAHRRADMMWASDHVAASGLEPDNCEKAEHMSVGGLEPDDNDCK